MGMPLHLGCSPPPLPPTRPAQSSWPKLLLPHTRAEHAAPTCSTSDRGTQSPDRAQKWAVSPHPAPPRRSTWGLPRRSSPPSREVTAAQPPSLAAQSGSDPAGPERAQIEPKPPPRPWPHRRAGDTRHHLACISAPPSSAARRRAWTPPAPPNLDSSHAASLVSPRAEEKDPAAAGGLCPTA
jgi:hypothetical protein